MTVSVEEAKSKLEELIDQAQEGESIVLTRDGEQVGQLTVTKKPLQFGVGKGTVWMAPDFDAPLEDFKEYM